MVVVFSSASILLNRSFCVNRTCLRDTGFIIHLFFLYLSGLSSPPPTSLHTDSLGISLPNDLSLYPVFLNTYATFSLQGMVRLEVPSELRRY